MLDRYEEKRRKYRLLVSIISVLILVTIVLTML